MTPMACLGTSALIGLNIPMRKPIAVSSFTGALDGMIWSSLIILNIAINIEGLRNEIYPSLFLMGLTAGNALGLFLGLNGGSEGAYILKTVSAVYMPLSYFEVKRLLFGKYMTSSYDNEYKFDLAISTGLSITGGLGTFLLTYNNYDITSGDALFISSNIAKGALILSAPIKTFYMLSKNDLSGFWGFYGNDPLFGRIGSLANLTGMALGAYISYRIAKKKDLSLLEGLIYSTIPALAFWAAMAPSFLQEYYRDYIKISPLIQVTFDVGTSLLVYGYLDRF